MGNYFVTSTALDERLEQQIQNYLDSKDFLESKIFEQKLLLGVLFINLFLIQSIESLQNIETLSRTC